MANLYYTLAGYALVPSVEGAGRTATPLRTTLEMAPGNQRHYQRPAARRIRWTLPRPGADEAIWATWRAAALAAELGATLIEPDGSTYTVALVSFADPPTGSTIASGEGTAAATGTIERDLTMELETL